MKNKEKAGIGIDETRAEVIETLLRRHYIALEKKELKPTANGTELITLVEKIDPMIADPVLTAMWEDQLSAIEQGGLSLGDFEAAIGQWLTRYAYKPSKTKHQRTQPTLPGYSRVTTRVRNVQRRNKPLYYPYSPKGLSVQSATLFSGQKLVDIRCKTVRSLYCYRVKPLNPCL